MIEQVLIENYKSIRELKLPLRKLNVLIGSNGVGKSNFISFFELTKAIYEERFGSYTLAKGGIDSLLHHGRNISKEIKGLIDFDDDNAFFFKLKAGQSNKGYIECIGDFYRDRYHGHKSKDYFNWHKSVYSTAVEEASIQTAEKKQKRLKHIGKHLRSFTVYHFHDTSASSPMRGECELNDNIALRDNGANLAAYLYLLERNDEKAFKLIGGVIHSIAPYFKKFNLRPDPLSPNKIRLEWEEVKSDMYLNGYSFSDGTLRFIALATLLLQPEPPEVIFIDEPELGLHPTAINKLAALIKRASQKSQIIISTQSTNLVNCFQTEDIVVVDREENQSVFRRLSHEDLSVWIDDYNYSISDIWEKNLIGGQL